MCVLFRCRCCIIAKGPLAQAPCVVLMKTVQQQERYTAGKNKVKDAPRPPNTRPMVVKFEGSTRDN